MKRLRQYKNYVFVSIILALCAILLIMPDVFSTPYQQKVDRQLARVLEVDNSLVNQYGIVKAGSQKLHVEIVRGPLKGQTMEAGNDLLGKMETDKMFRVGDQVFVVISQVDDRIINAIAYDHDRTGAEIILVAIFALLLIGFAGWSGVRALLSFAFALVVMWRVLFPLILQGIDPVWIALAVVAAIAAVTIFLVAGVGRLALVALLGSLLGVLLTMVLAIFILPFYKLHGAVQPYSETLLYSGFEHLNLTRIFLAAIFIGGSGAVMDVAIDVSTAMYEVIQKRPDLPRRELIYSGFNVGRNMISTMVTTLLMAYVSGYMALLMVFMAQGIPPTYALNTNFVGAEILKMVVGSLGLVTVAPFTAIIGGLIYVRKSGNRSVIAVKEIPQPEFVESGSGEK